MFITLPFAWSENLHAQWLEGYVRSIRITVDESLVPGTVPLDGFPMLVTYSDNLLRSTTYGGYVNYSDGRDICFTDQDGITVLDYEIESYNPEDGSISAWVRIPSLAAESHTELFLYYGSPNSTTRWDTAGVWSENYIAVWHLHDDPSADEPQLTDATSYANHGTTGGNMDENNQAAGKVAGAIYFDGDENFATMPTSGFNTEAGSVELWVSLDSISDTGSDYFFAHRQADPKADRVYLRVWPDGEWGTGMGSTYDLERGDTLETDTWHHMAITWNDTAVSGFLDGAQDFGPADFTGLDTVREIYIMSWMPSSESASGILDELRVSEVERDSAWIVASYLNQSQPESFLQFDTESLNDLPCQAVELAINDSCEFSIYSNIDASDSGIPDPGCGNYEGSDIWFFVVVPDSGSFVIQTDTETEEQYPDNNGWMYHAGMALYSGSCGSLSLIGCYEDNSSYHSRMAEALIEGYTPGDTIWVRIWENSNNDNGKLKICCSMLPQVSCPAVFNVMGGGGYCQGDTGVAIQLSGSETGYLYTLVIRDTVMLDTLPGSGDLLIWSPILDAGTYKILAHHPADSCFVFMSDSAIVTRYDLPQLFFKSVSVSCFEFDDGTITATISGGEEPYQLAWTGPGGFVSSISNLTNLSPGEYTLTVTDNHLCSREGSAVTITEPDLLVASLDQVRHLNTYEANDGSIDISIAGGTTPYSVLWNGTDDYSSSDQDPMGMSVGYYDIKVTDDHGCQDSIEMIVVTVEEDSAGVFIPAGFSPNEDGYNDRFVILGIEDYPENELVIFNKQGVVIYHRRNYQNDWDGTPEKGGVIGGALPEGTYYYVFTFGESMVRKGYIYLNKE